MGAWGSLSQRLGLCLAVFSLSFLTLVVAAQAGNQYMYWSNTNNGTIGRALADSSSPNQNFITGLNNPVSIAVDKNYIYWADVTTNMIGRANLDGTGVNANFIVAPSVSSVAVDKNYIYWSERLSDTIGRANLDGTGANSSFITAADGPTGVALTDTKIYWSNYAMGALTSSIGRASLDGTGAVQNYVSGTNNASGIALDDAHIYWSNQSDGKIGRVDGSGANKNDNFITGLSDPAQLAFNSNFIYWGSATAAQIGRAFQDGTGAVPSFVGTNGAANGVAIDAARPELVASPNSYDYGVQSVGSNTEQSFTIANPGTGSLFIADISLDGTESSQFKLTSNDCNGPLNPGQSCHVTAAFVPTAAGSAVANIVISHSAGGPDAINLTGTAVQSTTVPASGGAASAASSAESSVAATTVALTPPSIVAKRPGVSDCVRLRSSSSKFSVPYTLSEAASVEATLLYKPRVKANIDSCHPGPKGRSSDSHFKAVRAMKTSGQAGKNKLRISAKGLKPGRYRVRMKAIDSDGAASQPSGVSFRLVIK